MNVFLLPHLAAVSESLRPGNSSSAAINDLSAHSAPGASYPLLVLQSETSPVAPLAMDSAAGEVSYGVISNTEPKTVVLFSSLVVP